MKSIWFENHDLPAFPHLDRNLQTDVLIIGGGLAGILTAYECQQAGLDYALIEQDRICHGVTGNTTAKITVQHGLIYSKLCKLFDDDTAKAYWKLNHNALERYRHLCRDIPCEFEQKPSIVYTTNAPQKIEQELNALDRLRIPANYVSHLPLPIPTQGAVEFKHQAQFHPIRFLSHIVPSLKIYEKTKAMVIHPNRVVTNHGTIRAENIIITTHFPILNLHGSYFMKMYQDRSYVMTLENAPNYPGMYVDECNTGLSFRNYKNLLLLGGGGHRTGKDGGGYAELDKVRQTYFPSAIERNKWATQDCMTLDNLPYVGKYSKATPNLFVATGFQKWGMTSSMMAATTLREILQNKENSLAEILSPSRSMLRTQLFLNLGESAKNLLKIKKPRCPHLGCALTWNKQERSWDCPCHGSRFSESGKLLDNPATGDLNRKPKAEP